MKIDIEYELTGPLAHAATKKALVIAVAAAGSLSDATQRINKINGLTAYRGGSHVAVHGSANGQLIGERLAIITE
jgi:ABC-type molybdate transport system substrate-binding protein